MYEVVSFYFSEFRELCSTVSLVLYFAPITGFFHITLQRFSEPRVILSRALPETVGVKDLTLKALHINMAPQQLLALLLHSSPMPSVCWPLSCCPFAYRYGLGSLSVCLLCRELGFVSTATEIQDSCFWPSWATSPPSNPSDRQSPEFEEPTSSPRAV